MNNPLLAKLAYYNIPYILLLEKSRELLSLEPISLLIHMSSMSKKSCLDSLRYGVSSILL